MWCEMNWMKIEKASGYSGVAKEMFMAGGDKCLKSLTYLISCSRISYQRNGSWVS